jgi:hypothetical protein
VLHKEISTSNERHTPEEGVGGIRIEASEHGEVFRPLAVSQALRSSSADESESSSDGED